MGAISGDINSLSMYCVDPADLSSRPIASMKSGDRAYVNSLRSAPTGARFFLDRLSTIAADGTTVINALGGVGRWLSEGSFGGLPAVVEAEEVVVAGTLGVPGLGATSLVERSVTTSDATPTVVYSVVPARFSIQDVSATVVAQSDDGLSFFKQDVEACFHVDGTTIVTEIGTNTTTTAKVVGTGAALVISLDPVGPTSGPIELTVTGNAGQTWRWTASIRRVWRST